MTEQVLPSSLLTVQEAFDSSCGRQSRDAFGDPELKEYVGSAALP